MAFTVDPLSRITDSPQVRVGHWTDGEAKTGCTVVMFERSCVASAHVAGGAPGSQETDLLDPSCLVGGVDAILLTGGSAFGLAASSGVRRYLEERGRGFRAGEHVVPIVPAAVIFDLGSGAGSKRPGPEEGYLACVAAEGAPEKEGRVGAGAGARVAKYMGMEKSSPGGLASRRAALKDGVGVGAIMVVNCYGAVVDPATGKIIAAPKDGAGEYVDFLTASPQPPAFGSTCIGVVTTDAKLSKADAKRVAIMAHDGLGRAVVPAHTPYDGDLIFVVSTGDKRGDVTLIGAAAADLVARCVTGAVAGS